MSTRILALIAIALVVVGTRFYNQLGMYSNQVWLASDVVCGLISLVIGVPLLAKGKTNRALGIMLMTGVATLVAFHILALPVAGAARTVHPGWKYVDGYNGALWGTLALRTIV